MKTTEERVDIAASKMTMRAAFLAAVFVRLERTFTKDGTAWVDGKRINFGEDYCSQLDDEELLGLCLHETAHAALLHPWRRRGRELQRFNIACDAVVDRILVKDGFKVPDVVDLGWVTDSMSVEDVYAQLPEKQGLGSGSSGDGTGKPSKNGCDIKESDDQMAELDMAVSVAASAKMLKACGKGGGMLDLVFEGVLDPKVTWEQALRHLMSATRRDDYSYKRVNRRFVGGGTYLPALYSEGIGGLVVAIDTSGSMSQNELNQIASEIRAIAQDCSPSWIVVVYCDTKVRSTARFDSWDEIELVAKGGGGTRFKPVFDYVEKNLGGESVAALLYFTDLYGNLNELDEPQYPVIWGATSERKVPFGDVVALW